MRKIFKLLNGITMYHLMLYFMIALLTWAVVLSLLNVLPYSGWNIYIQTVSFVAVCWAVNKIVARWLKVAANPESSITSGLILSAIAGPLVLPGQWLVLVVMAVAAMASKYILVYKKSHIFNPAATGVLVSAFLIGQPASWWLGSAAMLPLVLIGGVLVVKQIRRFDLVGGFFVAYLGLFIVDALMQGRGIFGTATTVKNLLIFTPMLFFVFVMLIEPLTAPQTSRKRILFGSIVGVLLFALQRFVSHIPMSFELSLLAGNAIARIIDPDFRQAFVLRHKEMFSSTIGNFWFEPRHPFAFLPGQFLEYTLAHEDPDSRGIRRYFSIASSPTEKQILLTTRFTDQGSSFKRELQSVDNGAVITASKVAGDFVLPKDQSKKLVFIAGGIGITPFRSMLKFLVDKKQQRDVVLLYGAQTKVDLVFADFFEQASKYLKLKNIFILSERKLAPPNWPGLTGRINAEIIKKEVPDFRERVFYISGPVGMVKAVARTLLSLGVARRNISRDYFPGY